MFPTQKQVLSGRSVYGNPRGSGGAVVSQKWFAENIVYVSPPFKMNMGHIPIIRIPFHKTAAPALARALAAIREAAKGDMATLDAWGVTAFGGSFAYRPMRGLVTLSMHAYGIAIDLDPARNGLHDRTPHFAKCPEVLKAFANEGFTWGGDWNGNGSSVDERRPDGMHWQATSN